MNLPAQNSGTGILPVSFNKIRLRKIVGRAIPAMAKREKRRDAENAENAEGRGIFPSPLGARRSRRFNARTASRRRDACRVPVRLAKRPQLDSCRRKWGAQPSRLWFGAPSRRTRTHGDQPNNVWFSSARAGRVGATRCARGGRAPHFTGLNLFISLRLSASSASPRFSELFSHVFPKHTGETPVPLTA